MKHSINKRPYLTTRVQRGLASILSRAEIRDGDELAASQWVARYGAWRVSSSASDPHDAEVSPAARGGGASSPRPASRDGGRR